MIEAIARLARHEARQLGRYKYRVATGISRFRGDNQLFIHQLRQAAGE